MNCRQVRPLLGDYSTGTLTNGARGELQEHLAQCEACTRELAQVRALDALLQSDAVEAPEPFVRAVMDRAACERRGVAPRWVSALDLAGPVIVMLSVIWGMSLVVLPGLFSSVQSAHLPGPLAQTAVIALGSACVAGIVAWTAGRMGDLLT